MKKHRTPALTPAQKQRIYRAKLRAAALRDGFTDLPKSKAESQALTAWANGKYHMIEVKEG